jgi:putative transcriptional regulator
VGEEARFFRIEFNMSQKILGELLGVDAQTVARWEKGQTAIPRTTDVAIRALYLEMNEQQSLIKTLLDKLVDGQAQACMKDLKFASENNQWVVGD